MNGSYLKFALMMAVSFVIMYAALNIASVVGSLVVFGVALALLRTQTPIQDVAWMKAMIPHHSSAIMVSQNATFEDPEAQQLAKEIIEAQKREIAEMKKMISRFENE